MPSATLLPVAIASIGFEDHAQEVARRLIGVTVLIDGVGGRIVETEAYDSTEPAAHGFVGLRPHNATLFGGPGHAYIYRSYGIHWCLNFVCRKKGHGAGVLIRALEPTHGIERMRERRGLQALRLLCAGPGRVGQALGIDRSFDGMALGEPPFALLAPDGNRPLLELDVGPRIGITKAIELPWRFGEKGSRYLSKPFRHA